MLFNIAILLPVESLGGAASLTLALARAGLPGAAGPGTRADRARAQFGVAFHVDLLRCPSQSGCTDAQPRFELCPFKFQISS